MNLYDSAQAVVTIALAAIPWFFPNCELYIKVIILLCVLIASIGIYCARLLAKLKSTTKELEKITEQHNALSVQFDEKRKLEQQYRKFFYNFSILLHLAVQNTKEAKLNDIYHAFTIWQNELNDGGTSNEDL